MLYKIADLLASVVAGFLTLQFKFFRMIFRKIDTQLNEIEQSLEEERGAE